MLLSDIQDFTLKLRKERNPLGVTFQFHLSEIKNIGKNKRNGETSEDEIIQYLKKTIQKLKDNEFSNPEESNMLSVFLPKMVEENEALTFISSLQSSDKGFIMKSCKEKYGSLVDMKMINKLVGEII